MWHIYLPGGAWCGSAAQCVARSKTLYGTSTLYPTDPAPNAVSHPSPFLRHSQQQQQNQPAFPQLEPHLPLRIVSLPPLSSLPISIASPSGPPSPFLRHAQQQQQHQPAFLSSPPLPFPLAPSSPHPSGSPSPFLRMLSSNSSINPPSYLLPPSPFLSPHLPLLLQALRPPFYGMLSSNSSINPPFHNWNLVRLIYCDGCGYSGTAGRVEVDSNGTVLYLDGRNIIQAVIEDLKAKGGIKSASQILLSGSSAGGQAVVSLCDLIAAAFPWAPTKCIADAGFFIDSKDRVGGYTWRDTVKDVVALHKPSWPACQDALPEADQWNLPDRRAATVEQYVCMGVLR
ncbi:unnamed protein product [Closterium sp. Naga37s-1]|nr:unnamed protein product [Closterium sp. Naga37s-1]